MSNRKSYPAFICLDCARKYGKRPPMLATWNIAECGVCGNLDKVTEPRDYGHLRDGWQNHEKNNSADEQ